MLLRSFLTWLKKFLTFISSVRRAYYVTTTTKKFTFKNGLQELGGVSFQNHYQIFRVFEELLPFLILSQVHNGLY